MGFTTDPQTWQDKTEYNYPLDQVIEMAQEALAAIQGSLQASYVNTVQNSPNYTRYAPDSGSFGESQPEKILREMQGVFIKLEEVRERLLMLDYKYKHETPDVEFAKHLQERFG